ncbi:MAG: hypothetical protein Q7J06_12375 [Bacteroidales bacterium]|nr:hypothetical protein [Bacteroidales bacterium]
MAEYPKYKQPFEQLTTIDERVDYIHNQVGGVQLALNQLLEKEELPTMAQITREVVLRETLQPLTGIRSVKRSPLTGRITQVVRHWPEGCNSLVDLAVGHGDTWVLPEQTDMYTALNDATPVVNLNEPVEKNEELWMVVRNGDAVNPHSITTTFIIEGAR